MTSRQQAMRADQRYLRWTQVGQASSWLVNFEISAKTTQSVPTLPSRVSFEYHFASPTNQNDNQWSGALKIAGIVIIF